MARQYTKRSDYCKQFDEAPSLGGTEFPKVVVEPKIFPTIPTYPIDFAGKGVMDQGISNASRTGSGRDGQSSSRSNNATKAITPNKYAAIAEGMSPYHFGKDGVDVRAAIQLCQLAYTNVPIVKNSVDLMSEFANGEIILQGGNEASRKFFEAWFSVIRLDRIKAQYFLEYYRGSNIFFYKQNGTLTADAIKKLSQFMNSKSRLGQRVPIRYTLLNPVDMTAELTSSFSDKERVFFKVLSQYELERLKNPKNDVDRAILDSFTPEERALITKGQFTREGIKIAIDPSRLIYSFAKKQDYEPFAIPFIFPVLADVNMKLELKKLDQAVMRTIENVILLVTMGAKPEEGGINPANIAAVQSIFNNEAVGRVLVADYTTKADFVIPDIAKVVGREKYEIVNEDIREGLQNVIIGDDKYASTQIKAQLFLERLGESRTAFLRDFLIPEMYAAANALGFRDVPTPVFAETSLKDEVQWMRGVTRLIELSILTPEEGVEAIKNGRLPITDDFEEKQKAFKKQKDSGLYVPLIGGTDPEMEQERLEIDKKTAEEGIKVKKQAAQAKKAAKPTGRPTGSKASVSVAGIRSAVEKTNEFFTMGAELCVQHQFSVDQSSLVTSLCKTIVESVDIPEWEGELRKCLSNPKDIPIYTPKTEIIDIAAELDVDTYEAALIYHGDKLQSEDSGNP